MYLFIDIFIKIKYVKQQRVCNIKLYMKFGTRIKASFLLNI